MAAKYHVELIIGTGELPPLLDYLAKLGRVYRVEIRPVAEQWSDDAAPPRVKRSYKKRQYKSRPYQAKIPGGIKGIITRTLSSGVPVSWADLMALAVKNGYNKNSLGSPLDRMTKTGEVKRVGLGLYQLGKEHKE